MTWQGNLVRGQGQIHVGSGVVEALPMTWAAQAALTTLRKLAQQGPLTLVFAARDTTHTNAVVLRELLLRQAEE
jgi:hypothetical protein